LKTKVAEYFVIGLAGCVSRFSYNPLERREMCRGGGREVSKKSAHSQPSNKGGSTSHRPPQSSHTARRNDVSTANHANPAVAKAKAARPAAAAAAAAPAYDQQVLCFYHLIDVIK